MKNAVLSVASPLLGLYLKSQTALANTIPEYLDIAFKKSFSSFLIAPMQVRAELQEFLEIVEAEKPKRVLEIGTARGGSLYLFCRVVDPTAKVVSLDLPGGSFGLGYATWRVPLYNSFAASKQNLNLIRGDSHQEKMKDEVKQIFGDEKIDLLFIDGDHRYEGVKQDFEMYGSLVKKGGLIGFHDIVPGPEELSGGVPKFWNELKKKHSCEEIVSDWNQGGYGIGLLRR